MSMIYKFVELSIVTDESIEEAVNAWVSRGWQLEGIRFVTTEASRRPMMAFISFTRSSDGEAPPVPPGSGPRLAEARHEFRKRHAHLRAITAPAGEPAFEHRTELRDWRIGIGDERAHAGVGAVPVAFERFEPRDLAVEGGARVTSSASAVSK